MRTNKLIVSGGIILALLAGAVTISKVLAQSRYDFAGTYTVSGTNPDGSAYKQTAVVTDYGDGYRVIFDSGETGIASDIGATIAIGTQTKGVPSVTILKIINDSQLEGFWQEYTSVKEGQEVWTQN